MKVIAIIQARMGSTRLPGKTMMDVEGKPMLWHVLQRVKKAKRIDEVVVATTNLEEDDLIEDFVAGESVKCFRGDKEDVLDRYYKAAKENNAGIIVRITADCPLIDPDLLDSMIERFIEQHMDYLSNNKPPSFPHGLDAEVFSFEALERAWKEAKLKSEHEHVTPYIWKNPDKFKTANFSNPKDLSGPRWTVDRKEDLEVVREIYSLLGDRGKNHDFNYRDVLAIYNEHPELKERNKGVDRLEGYKKSLREDETT